MPKAVNIRVIGNVIELSRDQWKGHVAKIAKLSVITRRS